VLMLGCNEGFIASPNFEAKDQKKRQKE
jgi:hypothetical protein